MSTATAPQFTPGQILNAGERAESEGHVDHARQYYGHLITHYAQSPEGQIAQRHLVRLGAGSPPPVVKLNPPAAKDHVRQGPAAHDPRGGPEQLPRARRADQGRSASRLEVASDRSPALAMSGKRDRVGRFLTFAVRVIGWLLFVAGTSLALLSIAGRSAGLMDRGLLPYDLHAGFYAGVVAAALGLMMVLVARLARAVADLSETMRRSMATSRARLDG